MTDMQYVFALKSLFREDIEKIKEQQKCYVFISDTETSCYVLGSNHGAFYWGRFYPNTRDSYRATRAMAYMRERYVRKIGL